MKISIKECILFLALICVTLNTSAQSIKVSEFNRNMGRYYKACLYMRDGVVKKSPVKFERAMRLIHQDSIQVAEFTPTAVDTVEEIPIGDHMRFDYATAKKYRGEIYIDPGNMREEPTKFSREEGKCLVMNRALKAHGKTTYQYTCPAGASCLAVVAETRGEVVLSLVTGDGKQIEGKSYEYDAVGVAKWQNEEDTTVTFTIENPTANEISFVVLAD